MPVIKILIVEDESWVRKGIIKMIKWSELNVELAGEAENGDEARRLVSEVKPDLIITDMKMPKVSGADFIRQLEELHPECEIIVLSGFSDFEYMKQAISSGVYEYLLKPVDEKELNFVLQKVLNQIHNKKHEKHERIQRSIEETLNQLVFNPSDMKDELTEIGFDFAYYSVMSLFDKEQLKKLELLSEAGDIRRIAEEVMQVFIFKNTLGELFILCGKDSFNPGRWLVLQRKIAQLLVTHFQEKYGVRLRVGIGGWKSGIGGIPETYVEARKCLRYERNGEMDIIVFDEIKNEPSYENLRIMEQNQVTALLEKGQFHEVQLLTECFFTEAKKKKYVRLSNVRKAIIDFMIALEHCFRKSGIELNMNKISQENYFDLLETMYSIDKLQEWTKKTIRGLLNMLDSNKGKGNVIEEIQKYIEHNYHEDLHLIHISQKYFMNHIYLSRLFKSQTGENFIDYLTRIRMLKAKELMEKGDLKIKEVAELVGYQNPYYFSQSFKKFFSE
jgi:two-component system response regulator YesN